MGWFQESKREVYCIFYDLALEDTVASLLLNSVGQGTHRVPLRCKRESTETSPLDGKTSRSQYKMRDAYDMEVLQSSLENIGCHPQASPTSMGKKMSSIQVQMESVGRKAER